MGGSKGRIMIEVKVSYHGPFMDITHKREERIRLDRPRARDLIEQLTGCYGSRFRDLLIDAQTGEEKRSTLLVANGRRLELDSELGGGEEVSFLTSIAGGANDGIPARSRWAGEVLCQDNRGAYGR
ncbi:MAG: MoaD/ThiS family protein [Candidatus Tectomicrobia bacterium]|uniref:MoaD/ThiS family protein n=1 Tax=Tectimicrobiota bacterium TaxID=2528274 RepID=A0A932FVN0_UNCTE|nr:MoaD/ThiS family protein [Candidatus Tectomicrobia bacterium]